MATGTQVPWTDPGGTPCCCVSCYDVAAADFPFPSETQNKWQNIDASDYAAILAGGGYSASINVSVANTGVNFPEEQTVNASNVSLLPLETANSNCYLRLQCAPEDRPIVSASSNIFGGRTGTYPLSLQFVRALGTSNGQTQINFSDISLQESVPAFAYTLGSSFVLEDRISAILFGFLHYAAFWNVTENALDEFRQVFSASGIWKTSTASLQLNFHVNGTTYTQNGLFISNFTVANSGSNLTGSATYDVTFTPTPP
jgi:hypothetical protein